MRLLIPLLLLCLFSCAPPFVEMSTDVGYTLEELHAEETSDPYVRVYQALYTTLEWYTYPGTNGGPSEYPAPINESEWPEQQYRKIYVNSRINADFDSKTRMQIVGMVVRDRFNGCTPLIYVWHQMELDSFHEARPAGSPALFGPADGDNRWQNIGRNERMEARLLNTAYQFLNGGNPFSGRFGLDTRPWVEWIPEFANPPEEEEESTEGPKSTTQGLSTWARKE
jgi:hypothetical protein